MKKNKELGISKKIRFEIFKRDNFCCAYCGRTPPIAILEVDHIIPKSKSGSNDINNLITSCFDCNRGKGGIKLERITPKLEENLEVLKEKQLQLKEFEKMIKFFDNQKNKDIDCVEKVFINSFPDAMFTDTFRLSVKKFLDILGKQAVLSAMEKAILQKYKIKNMEQIVTYFCGICWNIIKGKGR